MDEIQNPAQSFGWSLWNANYFISYAEGFMWLGSQDKIHKIIFVMAHYIFSFSIECLIRDLWNVSIFNVEPVDYHMRWLQ